jgi:hypothetical protein
MEENTYQVSLRPGEKEYSKYQELIGKTHLRSFKKEGSNITTSLCELNDCSFLVEKENCGNNFNISFYIYGGTSLENIIQTKKIIKEEIGAKPKTA